MSKLSMKKRRTDCRVCVTGKAVPFITVDEQDYWRCTACAATLLDKSCLPDRETEKMRYHLHENDPNDTRYRNFLSRLAEPLLEKLPPAQEGLDYGCGPGPALALMLEEAGHHMRLYDPFFHRDSSALERTYDFITCSETAEHFHRPVQEFSRFDRLLKPGGWLAIMTSFQESDDQFADWYYRRDPTHVVFYREETFQKLAEENGWRCCIPQKNVALMQKTNESS